MVPADHGNGELLCLLVIFELGGGVQASIRAQLGSS